MLAISIATCNKSGSDELQVVVENKTDQEVEGVKLYTNIGYKHHQYTDSLVFGTLRMKSDSSQVWSLTHLPKADGGFVLKYTLKSGPREREFGYFTNGNLLDDKYHIILDKDTVLILQE
ncbi:hypothetical protein [Fulvivirga ligni]|uniref:hypothetical protein n=1 Tax=Fulvivirga ligni TaxID=2904246 RepID=UPI001F2D764A|nr:hypothetical protein [Fulvivirga ligni]UII19127.1 hypothetical protein LVD16_14880 [Fulvivirga ligni]